MNASSSPPVTVGEWLNLASAQLSANNSTTARLDALVLLQDILQCDKSWLLAHPEQKIASRARQQLNQRLSLRLTHMPLAYIRGKRDFYNRTFTVTIKVLIPRPETETLIDLLLQLPKKPSTTLLDVGTGSGVIAITAKLEHPALEVYASDKEAHALEVARVNAQQLKANVHFVKSDLLAHIDKTFAIITANLPYVDREWETSPETRFEPAIALFADDHGLRLIKKLLRQATTRLQPHGFLLIEADPRQHHAILQDANLLGYTLHAQQDFIIVLQLQ